MLVLFQGEGDPCRRSTSTAEGLPRLINNYTAKQVTNAIFIKL